MKQSKFHAAMLHVAETEEPADALSEPVLYRRLRESFAADPRAYLAKLADLDRAHEANAAKRKPEEKDKPKEAGVDEGTERVKEMLADEWATLERFAAAEDAASK